MEPDLARQRHETHLLIDALSEEKLFAVRSLLDVLVEPLSKSLAMAPLDDEELTEEAIASIRLGQSQMERGEVISHEEVLREFGL